MSLDTISPALWRASLLALAGAAASMALGGIVAVAMPAGFARLAISSLVTASGLVITGLVVWSRTRACAGDLRRPGLVALLAFAAFHNREWLSLLPFNDPLVRAPAEFLVTFLAFALAMLVFKWVEPFDAREARKQHQTDTGEASS